MAAAVKKAVSTIGTVLKIADTAEGEFTQLCKIKSYPALGGAPEQLETTDLEDETQTFVPGVQSMDSMDFTANYTIEEYEKVLKSAGKVQFYKLEMGKDGEDGIATWEGQHSVYVNEGEVNAVREMTISVSPSSKIKVAKKAGE